MQISSDFRDFLKYFSTLRSVTSITKVPTNFVPNTIEPHRQLALDDVGEIPLVTIGDSVFPKFP